jgi:predicted DNA-binding ribbon-helix-helix protein
MATVERVQTGVRLEKRTLKVLKALAEYLDLSLGDLIEGVMLHSFEGKAPFSASTLAQIERLRTVYGLDLAAADSHLMVEKPSKAASPAARLRSSAARPTRKRSS